ncbi:hypothetical protein PFISCL1PPCAC_19090 [Pristionchus fissidentatus]|uniref:CUB-like domain-containing protein n=1 Tax=Pristionchus fissidentatus TaxID=1538716 RepID=A0AAV5WBM3_9BILA|nr:hypothetical protein PFISCL1PPCAC_19090 [Pristionchus fissidentatus]
MTSVLTLLATLALANAKVEYTSSTMYDIFDFQGKTEVPLPRCNNGCLLFASTLGNDPVVIDAYMKNLIVYKGATKQKSIGEVSKQLKAGTVQKAPLDLAAGSYSIKNLNGNSDQGKDVTVWVVEKSKASSIDYEIYDAVNMNRAVAVPKNVITVMSASTFTVKANKGASNSFTARLVGFDNAAENNVDKCTHAFKTADAAQFAGFEFHVNGPIISIVFNKKNPVDFKAELMYLNVRKLAMSGFITTPGFNGCSRIGGAQVYHGLDYNNYGDEFDLHSEPTNYNVSFDVDVNFAPNHSIRVKDMTNSAARSITSTPANQKFTLSKTQYVLVYYNDISAPENFIVRYTSTQ